MRNRHRKLASAAENSREQCEDSADDPAPRSPYANDDDSNGDGNLLKTGHRHVPQRHREATTARGRYAADVESPYSASAKPSCVYVFTEISCCILLDLISRERMLIYSIVLFSVYVLKNAS